MQDYIKNGIVVDGDILTKEYLRNIPSVRETETEYSVTCEYEQQIDNNLLIRVRKQVRLRGSDVFHKSIHSTKALRTHKVVVEKKMNEVVQLFVLPGFILSGYPCRAVQRATTMRYQISTMALIVALFFVSLFCIVTFVSGLIGDMPVQLSEKKSAWIGAGLFPLILIELTMIHGCFRSNIEATLSKEYKESGGYDYPFEQ